MAKKADFQISSSMNEGILEIIMEGELAKSEHDKMSNEIIALINSSGVKNVLVDIRTLKGRLSVAETYKRVRNYPSYIYKTHIAMLDIPENSEYQSFHETTAVNAGMNLKFFTDIDKSKDWLKSKQLK
jgi:hypothetical protein